MNTSPSLPIVQTPPNASTVLKKSMVGKSFKKCARCHTQANSNAQKSCKGCGDIFPCKIYARSLQSTMRGRSFKKCQHCGTEAKSNRQTLCKNPSCGKKFVSKPASPAKASGKRKRGSKNSAQKKRRLGSKMSTDHDFDNFMSMLNSDIDPYEAKYNAQKEQTLINSILDMPENPPKSEPLPEPLSQLSDENKHEIESLCAYALIYNSPREETLSFDDMLNQCSSNPDEQQMEEWERELMAEIGDTNWLRKTSAPVMV